MQHFIFRSVFFRKSGINTIPLGNTDVNLFATAQTKWEKKKKKNCFIQVFTVPVNPEEKTAGWI